MQIIFYLQNLSLCSYFEYFEINNKIILIQNDYVYKYFRKQSEIRINYFNFIKKKSERKNEIEDVYIYNVSSIYLKLVFN